MSIRGAICAFTGLLAITASTGCPEHGTGEIYTWPSPGTVELSWAVAGEQKPAACERVSATELQIIVYDTAGETVTTFEVPCERFELGITLTNNSYRLGAWLIDNKGDPITSEILTPYFALEKDETIPLSFDFTKESLLR